MRKTKIVCTMGPREADDAVLKALVREMDAARFNFSHGTHESHLEMLERVRKTAEEAERPVAMLLDTKGPEIRTGLLERHEAVRLEKGSEIVISPMTSGDEEGSAGHIYVTYEGIAEDISEGSRILIDDGVIELTAEKISAGDVICRVSAGGMLGERKGVNLPGVSVRLPDLTDKDIEDIEFGLEHEFDYIALSFVRNAEVVRRVRTMISDAGMHTKIIAKIESGEGIDNLKEIIEAADGIMVARGDLGVEIEAKMIPQLQREIISMCNDRGKIVITATQMLDSMMRNPRPTRAEVTDVANAVYEGSDAVMLSGETASGEYPVEALEMMASIAEYTEQFAAGGDKDLRGRYGSNVTISNTTCVAAVAASAELDAKAILAPTTSGATALEVSKCRPSSDVYAFSPDSMTVRQMMLLWGVRPVLAERAHSTDELLEDCMALMGEKGILQNDDICVFIAGVVTGRHGYQRSETNTMRIIQVRDHH